MIKLYYCETSCASHKVMLFLSEYEYKCELMHIDLRKQEHISSDYCKINPKGLVPALIDESKNKVICGSTDIMLYLLPESSTEIVQYCRDLEALHDPYLRTLSYHLLFMYKTISTEKKNQLLHLAKTHPFKERGEFLEKAILKQLDPKLIDKSYERIEESMRHMENMLKHNNFNSKDAIFIFGKHYTMADAAALATLYRIKKLNIPIKSDLVTEYYLLHTERESFNIAQIK